MPRNSSGLSPNEMRTLAAGLSACCRRLGLSEEAALADMGLCRHMITKLRAGKQSPDPSSLVKMRDWLMRNRRARK